MTISRRMTIALLALSSCGDAEAFPVYDTLLWGSTETLHVPKIIAGSPGTLTAYTPQLVNINHPHPETWCFNMSATLVQINSRNNNPWSVDIMCGWGQGRAHVAVRSFISFWWESTDEENQLLGIPKVAQRAFLEGPSRALAGSTYDTRNPVDRIVAQTILCQASGFNLIAGDYLVEVSAFFSPVSIGGLHPLTGSSPTMPTMLSTELQIKMLNRGAGGTR